MDDRQDKDADKVWNALAAIRGVAEDSKRQSGAETADVKLRRALFSANLDQVKQGQSIQRHATGLLRCLSECSKGTEACIDWLKKTGQFLDKELDLARRVQLFDQTESGSIVIRQKPLSGRWAVILIAGIFFLVGLWVGWVLFTNNSGFQQIAYSYAVGMILGNIAGYVLDRSFRFACLRDKVLSVAPWLDKTAGV